jgi:hypothetical protein
MAIGLECVIARSQVAFGDAVVSTFHDERDNRIALSRLALFQNPRKTRFLRRFMRVFAYRTASILKNKQK